MGGYMRKAFVALALIFAALFAGAWLADALLSPAYKGNASWFAYLVEYFYWQGLWLFFLLWLPFYFVAKWLSLKHWWAFVLAGIVIALSVSFVIVIKTWGDPIIIEVMTGFKYLRSTLIEVTLWAGAAYLFWLIAVAETTQSRRKRGGEWNVVD